jgi:hypothetical protein
MRKVRGTKANKNERMIEIKLRFWTNGFATRKGYVRPKHAWSSGVVRIERNDTHGIRPVSPKPFHIARRGHDDRARFNRSWDCSSSKQADEKIRRIALAEGFQDWLSTNSIAPTP